MGFVTPFSQRYKSKFTAFKGQPGGAALAAGGGV